MTPTRYQEVVDGLSIQARKVLDVVPLVEAWSVPQVIAELQRQGQAMREHRVIVGCLSHLKTARIVAEPEPGKFRRIAVRERVATKKDAAELPQQEQSLIPATIVPGSAETLAHAFAAKKPGQLERLGAISADLRQRAQGLLQLADLIDAAALATEDEIAALGADSRKLRQLQALLNPAATA